MSLLQAAEAQLLLIRNLVTGGDHITSSTSSNDRSVEIRCAHLGIAAGERIALTGASGSGKTRLFRAIVDLDLNIGEVSLAGKARERFTAPQWRQQVAFVPAEPGWWAVQVLAHFYQIPDETLLNRLGFEDETMDWAIDRLSTGERQRLALARALVLKPRVLLLDEPTSALDEVNKQAVEALLREFCEGGGAVILTTHEAAQIERLDASERRIENGEVMALAT